MDKDTGFCVGTAMIRLSGNYLGLDLDECTSGSHNCGSQQCINLPGSYKCRCAAGFEFNEVTMRCEDVNECTKFEGHVCSLHATCENTIGSFLCHCKPGFVLNADGRNCDGRYLKFGRIRNRH